MTEDIQFVCGACEKDYEGDTSNGDNAVPCLQPTSLQ